MGRSEMIKCDLCGHQFKTYPKKEEEYDHYDKYEVTNYYPLSEEKAHLVKGYICDDCYHKIGDIVKGLFIAKGNEFNNELQMRKDEELKKYNDKIKELEDKNNQVKNIIEKLKGIDSILNLDSEIIFYLTKDFPYTQNATYYLDSALRIEERTKLGKKPIYEWGNTYNIEIEKAPDNYSIYDCINKETFKSIILDCKIKDATIREVIEISNNI